MKETKILFVCPYPENVAPSQRLKFEQYYPYFKEAGYRVDTSSFINKSFWKIIYKPGHFLSKAIFTLSGYANRIIDLFRLPQYDIVYIHLWVTPFGPPFFEWLYRKFSKKIVYDIDDLVYLKNVKSNAHPIVSIIKGRSKPLFLMKSADHVITCTPFLDNFVKQYNQKTTDISSTIDTDQYQPVNKYSNDKKVIIGWSGSHSTSKFIFVIQNVLKRIAAKYDVELLVIGDPNVRIDNVLVTAIPWVEKDEVHNLQKIDIGIYPLPDEGWVYGKSGLKAIQYMALGIPTVATAIGANFRVIENGISGFLVNSEEEWETAIGSLIENAPLRKKLGMNGRERVENLFSLKANKSKYLKVLGEV